MRYKQIFLTFNVAIAIAMNNFLTQVFTVVYQIPSGKVSTYGEIAKMAGFPGYARQVGKALSKLPSDTKLPWYRVVNSKGAISLKDDDLLRQRTLLVSEGIEVNTMGKLNLTLYRWRP
jgi:methylated-DNA-protein-cysteine methyltransferase-like protein